MTNTDSCQICAAVDTTGKPNGNQLLHVEDLMPRSWGKSYTYTSIHRCPNCRQLWQLEEDCGMCGHGWLWTKVAKD